MPRTEISLCASIVFLYDAMTMFKSNEFTCASPLLHHKIETYLLARTNVTMLTSIGFIENVSRHLEVFLPQYPILMEKENVPQYWLSLKSVSSKRKLGWGSRSHVFLKVGGYNLFSKKAFNWSVFYRDDDCLTFPPKKCPKSLKANN